MMGMLLLSYTELEIDVWRVVSVVTKSQRTATKLMFQLNSAEARSVVAKTLVYEECKKFELHNLCINAFGLFDSCRKIRNQYAHAYWDIDGPVLRSAKLELWARREDMESDPDFIHISVESLRNEHEKFTNAAQKFREAPLLDVSQSTPHSA